MNDPAPAPDLRARELGAQALDLQRKHAADVGRALAPIRAATGADDATLQPVLQDAADAPDWWRTTRRPPATRLPKAATPRRHRGR